VQVAARAAFPGLTDHGLYWENISSVFATRAKVVLDVEAGAGRQRHLIIPNVPIPAVGAAAVIRPGPQK
jgi:hypothetical protein